jgi:hypothetical protein
LVDHPAERRDPGRRSERVDERRADTAPAVVRVDDKPADEGGAGRAVRCGDEHTDRSRTIGREEREATVRRGDTERGLELVLAQPKVPDRLAEEFDQGLRELAACPPLDTHVHLLAAESQLRRMPTTYDMAAGHVSDALKRKSLAFSTNHVLGLT